MKKKLAFITFFIMTMLSTGCSKRGGMVLLGLDGKGKMVKRFLPASQTDQVGEIVDEVSEESLQILGSYKSNGHWQLSKIYVGVGIDTKIGVAAIGVNAGTSLDLVFQKK